VSVGQRSRSVMANPRIGEDVFPHLLDPFALGDVLCRPDHA
jgi:hypothetical protein